MSHYHMNGAIISAYHSDDESCGGGSHTRYEGDGGERRYWHEMGRLWSMIHGPRLARHRKPQRPAFPASRHRRTA